MKKTFAPMRWHTAAIYGDSPVCIKHTDNNISIVPKNSHHFFMRLKRKEKEFHFNTSVNHKFELHTVPDVSIVIAGSDGIGNLFEVIQKEISSKNSFKAIRNQIHKFVGVFQKSTFFPTICHDFVKRA
jgi:hypothetical protein